MSLYARLARLERRRPPGPPEITPAQSAKLWRRLATIYATEGPATLAAHLAPVMGETRAAGFVARIDAYVAEHRP